MTEQIFCPKKNLWTYPEGARPWIETDKPICLNCTKCWTKDDFESLARVLAEQDSQAQAS